MNFTGRSKGLNDVLTHAGNAIVNFCDLFVVSYPSRFGHFIYPSSVTLSYLVGFMLPYSLAGGENCHGDPYIYKAFDWRGNPKKAMIFASVTAIFFITIHFFLVSLMKIRERIHKKMTEKKTEKMSLSNFDKPCNLIRISFYYRE